MLCVASVTRPQFTEFPSSLPWVDWGREMFMMATFVAVGISRPTDDVIGVKTDWKENNNKDRLFSGRTRKANGWNTEGKMLLPTWKRSQACFLTFYSLQS